MWGVGRMQVHEIRGRGLVCKEVVEAPSNYMKSYSRMVSVVLVLSEVGPVLRRRYGVEWQKVCCIFSGKCDVSRVSNLLRNSGLMISAAKCNRKGQTSFSGRAALIQAYHFWYCELMLKTNEGRDRKSNFAVLVVRSASYASAKTLECEGASHHLAFIGKWPTVIHAFLALLAQWMSFPTRKWGRGIRSRCHLVVFMIDVNQEK